MERHKVCAFFGHRKVAMTENLQEQIRKTLENLIVAKNVRTFLFGSRSVFNCYCHLVVSELKMKYPSIKRIAYTCKGETCVLVSEEKKWKKIQARLKIPKLHLLEVEEEFEYKEKYESGRGSYVERNQAMIDNSEYCIFYYDEKYQPPVRKYSKQDMGYYQPKSGTALAYTYAKRKKKKIINILCREKV